MNYLAHAYLSFNDPEIIVGNMISDFVKGKAKFTFSPGIQKGIVLHRSIDEFTDAHPATQKAKQFFKPAYRLYSGAFVDVLYDYFLANDANEFHNEAVLYKFALAIYEVLEYNKALLPDKFQKMFFYMRSQNWLYNYQFEYGLEKSFGGLVHRALYLNESARAFSIFKANFFDLKNCYDDFFPELKTFALNKLSNLYTIDSIYL